MDKLNARTHGEGDRGPTSTIGLAVSTRWRARKGCADMVFCADRSLPYLQTRTMKSRC
ncbi:MAG: hypothetical protein U5K69_29660 [Balneolaceae bacterium]|nr:hypothetical protein [Balneolaceae bacterium]